MATDNVLEIKNLHTYFYTDGGVIKAVDGVDVELRRGATLGIVGEVGKWKERDIPLCDGITGRNERKNC